MIVPHSAAKSSFNPRISSSFVAVILNSLQYFRSTQPNSVRAIRHWGFAPLRSRLHSQWAVEHCEAEDFGFGDVWAVTFAAGSVKEGAGMVSHARFLPLAGKDIDEFVGEGMDVRGNGDAGAELAQDRDAACCFVLVEREQLDAKVRAGLPLFVLRQGHVLKHGSMKGPAWEYLQVFCRSTT